MKIAKHAFRLLFTLIVVLVSMDFVSSSPKKKVCTFKEQPQVKTVVTVYRRDKFANTHGDIKLSPSKMEKYQSYK